MLFRRLHRRIAKPRPGAVRFRDVTITELPPRRPFDMPVDSGAPAPAARVELAAFPRGRGICGGGTSFHDTLNSGKAQHDHGS